MSKGPLWKQCCKTPKNTSCNYAFITYDFFFSSARLINCPIDIFKLVAYIYCQFYRDLIVVFPFRPKVKTPPQDTLLRLEKDQTLNELSVESSLFAFKLGLANHECSLLMNGLVYEPNEVYQTNIKLCVLTLLRY